VRSTNGQERAWVSYRAEKDILIRTTETALYKYLWIEALKLLELFRRNRDNGLRLGILEIKGVEVVDLECGLDDHRLVLHGREGKGK